MFKSLYSVTYFIYIPILLLVIAILSLDFVEGNFKLWLALNSNKLVMAVLSILAIVILFMFRAKCFAAKQKGSILSIRLSKGNISKMSFNNIAVQSIPLVGSILSALEVETRISLFITCLSLILIFLYLRNKSAFNLCVFLCRYKQYTVQATSGDFILVSKVRINDFNRSIQVWEINDETLLAV